MNDISPNPRSDTIINRVLILTIFLVGMGLSWMAQQHREDQFADRRISEFESTSGAIILKIQDKFDSNLNLLEYFSNLSRINETRGQSWLNEEKRLTQVLIASHPDYKMVSIGEMQRSHWAPNAAFEAETSFTYPEQLPNQINEKLLEQLRTQKNLDEEATSQILTIKDNTDQLRFFDIITYPQTHEDEAYLLFVLAELDLAATFEKTLQTISPDWVKTHIYTQTEQGRDAKDQPVYSFSQQSFSSQVQEITPAIDEASSNPYAVFIPKSLSLGNQKFSLVFSPISNDHFVEQGFIRYTPLALGVVLTLTICMLLFDQKRQQEKVLRKVAERTKELSQTTDQLKSEVAHSDELLKQLEHSRAELMTMTNSIDGILWECSLATKKFNYVSERIESILGFTPKEWIELDTMRNHIFDEEREETVDRFYDSVTQGKSVELVYRVQHKHGYLVWVKNIVTPDYEGDELIKISGIMFDITTEIEQEDREKSLESQLQHAQKMEAVGQLAAGIAHEINTPSQFVGDNINFLKDSFEDLQELLTQNKELVAKAAELEELQELAAQVQTTTDDIDLPFLEEEIPTAINQSLEGVSRISTIVKAMKEFSHPGTKEKQSIDLNHAIENTLTVARNEWKYVAELKLELCENLPPVECLAGELNQVILNIVVNAAHAIADKQEAEGNNDHGTIGIKTEVEDERCVIRITDSGSGMPEEVKKKIFDPFFTTKGVGKGTGQGLAIAYSVVVDKHQGSIAVESTPGEGTEFIIQLPFKTQDNNQEEINKSAANEEAAIDIKKAS